jgi:hypothetical protein
MGRVNRDRVFFIALLAIGVLALALSFVLDPTPNTFVRDTGGHRVPVDGGMHAVDYVILLLRIGGVVALIAGAYLTYRSFHPDRAADSDSVPPYGHDRYEDIPPEAGNPSSRAGINVPI